LLRGSECWIDAIAFDADHDGHLSWNELEGYFRLRTQSLIRRFDSDSDGKLDPAEAQAADTWLRADLYALAGGAHSRPVVPAQALGIINALLIAGLLGLVYRHRRWEGQVFALMLVSYPITRFLLESLRDQGAHDVSRGVFTHNQVTSMIAVVAAVGLWAWWRRKPASAGPTARDRAAAGGLDKRGKTR
jgi:prolipoprotein diacylglyceryltransferase